MEGYRRYFYVSALIIALGVIFSTIMKDTVGSLGIVFIAVGGLFFILAMNKKRKEDEQKKE